MHAKKAKGKKKKQTITNLQDDVEEAYEEGMLRTCYLLYKDFKEEKTTNRKLDEEICDYQEIRDREANELGHHIPKQMILSWPKMTLNKSSAQFWSNQLGNII